MNIISQCRVCGNTNLETVIELGEQYLTGVFPNIPSNENISSGPLTLVKCSAETIFAVWSNFYIVMTMTKCMV